MTPYYEDETVTLYHGDCREISAWLKADVLVTDPPSGIDWRQGSLHSRRADRRTASPSIHGDHDTAARDQALALWGDRPAVVFGTWRRPRPPLVTHRLIWHKVGRKPGISPAPWFPADEEIYILGGGWTGRPTSTVITTHEAREREPARVGHPTPKPVGLMEQLIVKCPRGVVADPFAGSGATLLAARAQGRRSVGVEVDERYCELIASRLAQGDLFEGAA